MKHAQTAGSRVHARGALVQKEADEKVVLTYASQQGRSG